MRRQKGKRKLSKAQRRKLSKAQKLNLMVAEWRAKMRAKKMGFGAPSWARKPAKTVSSVWFVPGGGIETNRSSH